MAEQWEYKSVLCGGGDDMETTLIPLGEQGWEAVGFAAVTKMAQKSQQDATKYTFVVTEWGATQYRVLLKRRKP